MNKKERDYYYPILVQRDGEFCQYCQRTKDEVGDLIIHEIEYQRPLQSKNMKLLCRSCNQKFPREVVEMLSREATPEHRVKLLKEFEFRKWAMNQIQENNNHYEYDELIDSGAYVFDLSVATTKRYMKPLMSNEGPFSKPMAWNGELHVFIKGREPFMEETKSPA